MVFAFDRPDLDVGDNVRHAARGEYDQAIAEVSETDFEVHDTIRNVRRRLKRIRSLLRLIRPVFPQFEAEDEMLRAICAELSSLRDGQALVEAVDELGRHAGPALALPVLQWRRALVELAATQTDTGGRDALLLDLRIRLRDARVRSELWELSEKGSRVIVAGLTATYRRARQGYRAAAAAEDDAVLFHEWRKQVKHHSSHLKLLRGLMPAFADARRQQAGRLAAMLGDLQNLSLLRTHLGTALADAGALDAEISRRLARTRRRALNIGRRLFADRPRGVRRRWRAYVDDWHAAQRMGR